MASKIGQLKPFMLEEKKEGPNKTISETTANKWQGCMIANIKKEEKWLPFLSPKIWQPKKITNRGLTGADALTSATQIDMLLEYVSQYAPNALYRDITLRATSLDAVWVLVRNWAGLKTSGSKQQIYYQVKNSWDPNSDLTENDFYFQLRNAKEDCLLLAEMNGGKIKFHGSIPTENEDLTPTLESDVVLDWMDAIGGNKLVNQTFRVFSKELETESLADLRQRISDNLPSLISEAEQVDINRTFVPSRPNPRAAQPPRQRRPPPPPQQFRPSQTARPLQHPSLLPPCKLCAATKPAVAHTHGIGTCYQLYGSENKQVTRAIHTDDPTEVTQHEYPSYDHALEYEDDQYDTHEGPNLVENETFNSQAKTCLANVSACNVIKIRKVNIHESPILACTGRSRTIYCVLDTGATASLITLRMAKLLNLQVHNTSHQAVQVDGEAQLHVLGEVHTSFTRGGLSLKFSALVVSQLSVDILAGTNFHVENDVYSRMAKGTIHIGDHCVLQSSPPSLLALDTFDTRSVQRLVKVPSNTIILPGTDYTLSAPPDIPPDSFVMVEPNLQQTKPFFEPIISQLEDGSVTVKNQSPEPVLLKKNCQAFSVYTTSPSPTPSNIPNPLDIPPIVEKPLKDILSNILFDGNLSKQDKQPLLDIISSHSSIFQPSLPGYNHSFGPVYAAFSFASKARPVPQKLRSPNYGSHQDLLFNQKCQQLKQQGVLVDPIEHGIQPIMAHNSWVVKKPSAASKSWEKCTVNDVRLVVGLDPLNKFLMDPPGKITKTDSIYTSLASWEFMGELDFSDFYFQIKFRTDTERDKQKLGYLCIRTAMGTMCFTAATQGLLGMDVYQDELTDKIFGDLVVSNHLVKIADNIYFGADSLTNFTKLLQTILQKIETADLRIKPSKLKINVQSADILGLHWHRGKLSPSQHKLDPLAQCEPPKTVSALRSWLGSVRFNEICLPGAQLALHSKLLDEQIPSSRSGKEEIVWTSDLLTSFKQIQHILQQPLSVTVPRRGDTIYLATDACTSLPAGGTKMFLQRPGLDGFLPSFNFGCRLPQTLREWSPCEVEAYFLNKGIEKAEYYTKLSGNPGVALTDCKPVFQAKQKLDRGEFSSSKRLQNLLANISAKHFSLQLLSARVPSPILKMVDFASRNPVECVQNSCTICKDEMPAVILAVSTSIPDLSLASVAAWKDIQQSCPDLKRVHALLMSGRQLSKKEKKVQDIRTYLRKCTINKQGLIVSLKQIPFQPKPEELIVIPRPYSFTFSKALHVQLNHPLPSQMMKQFSRQYFMLDESKILQQVWDTCEVPCQASKIIPKETMEFKTETKPDKIGKFFNADVIEESGQKILIIRENLTSFTDSMFIKNQTKLALKDALIVLTSRLKLGNHLSVRVDGQSALASLRTDKSLEPLGIFLEVGQPKNVNKNATADKAIRELREQLVRLSPHGGPVSEATLARATAFLNTVIRHTGRSAKELWMSRDQLSGENIQLNDRSISDSQFQKRQAGHLPSAKYASRNGQPALSPTLQVGDTVFVKSDRSKSKARDSFFVLDLNETNKTATIQKFPMTHFKHHPIQVQYQNLYKVKPHPTLTSPSFPTTSQPVLTKNNQRPTPPTNQPRKLQLSLPPSYTPDSDSEDDDYEQFHHQDNPIFPTPPHDNEADLFPAILDDLPLDAPLHVDDDDVQHNNPEQVQPLPRPTLPLSQPLYGQKKYLKVGDIIAIVQGDVWCKVVLSSHSGHKNAKKKSLYWNYTAMDGSNPTGSYLFPGESWGVLRGEEIHVDLAQVDIIHPNQPDDGPVGDPVETNPHVDDRNFNL